MNRTCKVCGLIFQTSTRKEFNICYKCFITMLKQHFELILPRLYEMSNAQLNDLLGLTSTMNILAKTERDRRNGYVSAMLKTIGG